MTNGVASIRGGRPATARVPRHVALFSAFLKLLVARGVPLGPNGLITIRGRVSGQPRTVAVAILNVDGRRWVWCPWGDVNWVRNLRAAGEATISFRGREETVRARELDHDERVGFFRDVIGSYARGLRGGVTFIRLIDGVDLDRPVEAAGRTAVFELTPA
ncbi:MAG TPA: nitroreductase family deazaflavin-dependent oxidoreductase [Candidatus Limnocylindrales bacterium]|nr:nitroreductase family deazaflavin-dependent oxidoreductase [Candidatus Limnocylindrales bacterium]